MTPLFYVRERKYPETICASYIDDIGLLVTGKTEAVNSRQLEKMAATCVDWGDSNALVFDNPKTELTHFHGRIETDQTAAAKVRKPDRNIIPAEEVQRWHGVWLDRNINFKYHVKTKNASALRAVTAIARLASREKGLSYYALRQLFQTCAAPISNFRAEVWWNGQVGLSNIIQQIQNQAMSKIGGAFQTTPSTLLEAETACRLTAIQLYEMQRKNALRLLSMPPTHPVLLLCPESWPNTEENNQDDHPRSNTWYNQLPYQQQQRQCECLEGMAHNSATTTSIPNFIADSEPPQLLPQYHQRILIPI